MLMGDPIRQFMMRAIGGQFQPNPFHGFRWDPIQRYMAGFQSAFKPICILPLPAGGIDDPRPYQVAMRQPVTKVVFRTISEVMLRAFLRAGMPHLVAELDLHGTAIK